MCVFRRAEAGARRAKIVNHAVGELFTLKAFSSTHPQKISPVFQLRVTLGSAMPLGIGDDKKRKGTGGAENG